MGVFIAVLLLIVIIFGVSSGMQSYATAHQAQATIEVARVAQISSWGNLVTILTVVLLLVASVALITALLWFMYKRSTLNRQPAARISRPTVEHRSEPQLSMNDLTQLMMLDVLRSMRSPAAPALPDKSISSEEGPVDEPFHWLR
jgi:hypothetical protein